MEKNDTPVISGVQGRTGVRSVGAQSRAYFSITYLHGAALLAREIFDLETSCRTIPVDTDFVLAHRAKVVASITSSVAALEATINEIFADANESDGCIATLTPQVRQGLDLAQGSHKNKGEPKILWKFRVAHEQVIGSPPSGNQHWQDAQVLIYLRNSFTHFETDWVSHDTSGVSPSPSGYFARSLANSFAMNPLAGTGNPFYPDKLLGHGCAEWSFNSALKFTDHFWTRIGVVPSYDGYRAGFRTR